MQIVPVTWCLCLHSRLSTYDLQQSVHSLFLWCLHIFPSQTNQLGVNTYPPHPLLLQPKSITPAKQHFPSPSPLSLSLSLSLSSPFLLQASPLNHPASLPPFSLSLSPFQWMHNPPFSQACPGGWGSGGTHTHTTSAEEQTPITGSDKDRAYNGDWGKSKSWLGQKARTLKPA